MLSIGSFLRVAGSLLAAIAVSATVASCNVQTYDDAVSSINNGGSPPPPPPPPGSPPPPPPPPPPAGFNPVFSEIQANVFTPDCASSSCHGGGAPAANLNLTAGNSYAMLVDIDSFQEAGLKRVLPGNPNNSYLIQKLEGTANTGGQMPPSTPLPQSEIDTIRQWITDGALDDTMAAADPVRVSSISPAPNAMLTAPPTQIVAGFDRDLNATSVDATTFLLTASGGDGQFNNGNETAITAASISVPVGNQRSAVFDLTGVALGDDTYRISLLGSGGSVIQDLDANALDGEYLGALPSGNSVAGGDFVVNFTLTTPVVIGPTLDQIQAVVFTPMCSTCHTGPNGVGILPASMDLSNADASFAALVGVPSVGDAGIVRVAPNDPDNSYLIQKLEGTVLPIMPPTGPLDPAVIAEIRQWIADGALR